MLLSIEEREKRLTEVFKINVPLDADPVAYGLSPINAKIAELQAQKDRVNTLFLEAIKNRHEAQSIVDEVQFNYDNKLETLLATNAEVQGQKSEALRKAVANTKIVQEVLDLHHAQQDLSDADSYFKQIQQSYSHLEGVNSSLSRQISVIQMSLQVGEINREELNGLFGKKLAVTK